MAASSSSSIPQYHHHHHHLYSNYFSINDMSDHDDQFPLNSSLLMNDSNIIMNDSFPINTIPIPPNNPMFINEQRQQPPCSITTYPSALMFPAEFVNGICSSSSTIPSPISPPCPNYPADNNILNVAALCGINGGCTTEFGDNECAAGFILHQDLKPTTTHALDPTSFPQNWVGIQSNIGMQAAGGIEESNNIKVGRYSVEERKDRILRYLKKRNQRNFNKTIKYACRKTLADRRVRVRGRFARNNTDLSEEEDQMLIMKKELPDHHHHDDESDQTDLYNCSWDSLQMKHDEDEWLQEAMANLMYLPYIAG